jgi:hypothetical protein
VARLARSLRGRTCARTELLDLRDGAGEAAWQTIDTDVGLLRAPPSGTWEQRRAHTFALAEDWLGRPELEASAAISHLVRRYLAAFGPASRNDISTFTGLPPGALAPLLERLKLLQFRDEQDKELLDVPRAPLPDPDTPAPVRFLPTWDAVLLVHARRTGILPERYRPLVFNTKNPPSVPTFLVDGAVAGTWRYDAGRIQLTPFERLSRSVLRELREESERLAAFHE